MNGLLFLHEAVRHGMGQIKSADEQINTVPAAVSPSARASARACAGAIAILRLDPSDPKTAPGCCFSAHAKGAEFLALYEQCMSFLRDLPPKTYTFCYDRGEKWVESIAMSKSERWDRDLLRREYEARIYRALRACLSTKELAHALRHAESVISLDGPSSIWHTSDQSDVEIYVLSALLLVRLFLDSEYRDFVRGAALQRISVEHAAQSGVSELICTYASKYACEHGAFAECVRRGESWLDLQATIHE